MGKRSAILLAAWAAVVLCVQTASAQQTSSQNGDAERYERLWELSGHADRQSSAFNRWNADGSVPATCAGCHTATGFLDLTGADGSAKGTVEHPVPIGETVTCAACHGVEPALV